MIRFIFPSRTELCTSSLQLFQHTTLKSEAATRAAGVGVGRGRLFSLESELESVIFCRLRLVPAVKDQISSIDADFGLLVMHPPESTEETGNEV